MQAKPFQTAARIGCVESSTAFPQTHLRNWHSHSGTATRSLGCHASRLQLQCSLWSLASHLQNRPRSQDTSNTSSTAVSYWPCACERSRKLRTRSFLFSERPDPTCAQYAFKLIKKCRSSKVTPTLRPSHRAGSELDVGRSVQRSPRTLRLSANNARSPLRIALQAHLHA